MPRVRLLLLALLAALAIPASALAVPGPPANDNFANAIVLQDAAQTVNGANVGATFESGEPSNPALGDRPGSHSVWYRFVATKTRGYTVDTCTNGTYDSTIGVYTGSSVNALSFVAGNDDACSVFSSTTFTAVAGTTYSISVDGFSGSTGGFTLRLTPALPTAPTFSSTSPAGPSPATAIKVKGTALAGSTVRLYTTSDCSGTPIATDTAATFADPGIDVTVPANQTTTFHATADNGTDVSACSTSSIDYTSDSTAPDAPDLTGTDPVSPDAATDITVQGTAEPGSSVALYTTANCTGDTIAATAAQLAAGVGVTVEAHQTTTFSATATDAAGNVSDCSTPITYTNDSPPDNDDFASASVIDSPSTTDGTLVDATPQMGEPDPAGDSQTSSVWYLFTPTTTGPVTADLCQDGTIDATLGVYTGTSVDALERVADNDDDPLGLCGTLPRAVFMGYAGTTYHLLVNVSRSGAPSQTPGPFTLTLNDGGTLPDAPTVDDPGTGSSTTVHVTGRAPAGSRIKLYENDDCSGEPVATGTAETFAGPGLAVDVADMQGTTTFRATDLAEVTERGVANGGYTSACSDPVSYVRDSEAPDAPNLTGTDPSAPSNATTVNVQGSAEDGSTITIYAKADCGGDPVSTGPESDLAGAGIAAEAAQNATTTYSAQATDAAGNVSDCSNSVDFTNDSTPPAAPTLTRTDPASPNVATSIKVLGSAEDGSTVTLYTSPYCAGHFATIRSAAELADPGLSVTVPAHQMTTFSASATDAAGNRSNCSNAISYDAFIRPANDNFVNATDLGSAPATLTGSTLDASRESGEPGSGDGPSVWYRFTPAVDGRATLDLCGSDYRTTLGVYTGTGVDSLVRQTSDINSCESTTSRVSLLVTAGTTYYVSVAGFRGNSGDYQLHYAFNPKPTAPTFTSTDPESPNIATDINVLGNAPDGATVDLYASADCSGDPVAEGNAADFANPGLAVTVDTDTTTAFHATTTKDGLASGCSTDSISYTEVSDSTPPDAPAVTATDPASPNAATDIKVMGSGEPGSTVKLYETADCTGDPVATGTAAAFATPGLAVTVASGSTTTFHATATDAAGNTSPCSSTSVTYISNNQTPPGGGGSGGGGGGGGGSSSTPPSPSPSASPTASATSGPTPAPSTSPTPTLTATVNRSRKAFRHRHGFRVSVSCGSVACQVTITVRLKAKHHRAIVLRTRTLTLPANTIKALRFHATAAKRRFVRHHPHARLKVTVASPDATTQTAGGELKS